MNSIWDYIPCRDSVFVVSQYILQNTPIYGLLEGRGGEGGGVALHKPKQCGTQQFHSTGVGVDGWRLTS